MEQPDQIEYFFIEEVYKLFKCKVGTIFCKSWKNILNSKKFRYMCFNYIHCIKWEKNDYLKKNNKNNKEKCLEKV